MWIRKTVQMLLAIETSCDETSAAVVDERGERPRLLSSVVASQNEFHARFGGVVPEIAARRHAEILQAVIADALGQADMGFSALKAVAVVNGPGLIGSLVVGVAAAKAIALARDLPLIGVNHLAAHIYAVFLMETEEPPAFPLLALIASGGHTHLVFMRGHGEFEVVGRTRDDAAGEAFDKAGKLLGVEYPGGPALAALADTGHEDKVHFPIAEMDSNISLKGKAHKGGGWDFSFSGTKTALARYLRSLSEQPKETLKAAVAAGFQKAIVRPLTEASLEAAEALGAQTLAIVGGVACNQRLRKEMAQAATARGINLIIPPPWLCTDNAAMVGATAHYLLAAGVESALNLDCEASLPLLNWK
jgi:N6-L-threonylcarbamoyladenine synthase